MRVRDGLLVVSATLGYYEDGTLGEVFARGRAELNAGVDPRHWEWMGPALDVWALAVSVALQLGDTEDAEALLAKPVHAGCGCTEGRLVQEDGEAECRHRAVSSVWSLIAEWAQSRRELRVPRA